MSVKLGDIDLNSEMVSVEGNSKMDGITLSESAFGVRNSGNSTVDGSLMNQSRDGDRVGGCLHDSRVDEVRVSGEAKVEMEGMVKEGGDGIGEVEMETRDEGEAVGAVISKNFDVSVDEVVANGVGTELSSMDAGSKLGFEAVDNSLPVTFVRDEKGDVSQCTEEGHSHMVSLDLDLNAGDIVDGESKSDNRNGNERTEVNKIQRDLVTTFSDTVVENAAIHINTSENGNQDATFIEQEAGNKQSLCNEGSKNVVASRTEKEGEYFMSDLIWGKVRSHPWWPGQIYDPSASSDKALKYKKKDSFLIAYFGDQTFAWNDASSIKPFQMHFSQMEKQSNMDSFIHAVDCALEEVSRRVEYGLACSCLPKEVCAKIESQVIVNPGIRKESSVIFGGDNFSTAASFATDKLVYYLKDLAQAPLDVTDRLEFVITRAQWLAFNRWKGYSQLPSFRMVNGFLENVDDVSVFGKEEGPDDSIDYAVLGSNGTEQVSSGKRKSSNGDNSSRKRKQVSGNGVCSRKKEKCIVELMPESCSNAENSLEEKTDKKMKTSSSKLSSVIEVTSMDSRRKSNISQVSLGSANGTPLPEKLFKVGDRIRKVANQLSGSALNVRYDEKTVDKKSVNSSWASHGSCSSSEKALETKIPTVFPPVNEMLSQLYLAAMDPINGHNFLISVISFWSDFRGSVCVENSNTGEGNELRIKTSGKKIMKNSADVETIETFVGREDSYWTDRIIEGNPGEQILFDPESEKEMPNVESEAALHASTTIEPSVMNLESQEEKTVGPTEEKLEEYSPTVLILNFTDLESIPSEEKLNKIFSHYGPLYESDTEILKKSKRAKVVFKRRADADRAFSSAGKFSIFGPSLLSYRLNYLPSMRKHSTPGTKRKRKDATSSVEGKKA